MKQLEVDKHLKYFPRHQFEKKRVLIRALKYTRKVTILEAFLIKSLKHSLHDHLDIELLVPFRNDVIYHILFIVFSIFLIAFTYLRCNVNNEILKFVYT